MTIDNEELDIFRDMVKRALLKEVSPYHSDWDKAGCLPREIWRTLGQAGLLCVDLPEKYGGSGVSFRFSQLILEEVARLGFVGLAGSLAIQSDIVAQYILKIGNESQKAKWLPGMCSGEIVSAIAMTEPSAGSDLQGMQTTARFENGHYILNGSKTFITNGVNADMVIVAAKTDPALGGKGISLFLVDSSLPGFSKGKALEKIGQHAGDTAELFFNDLRVPEEALLGEINHGFFYLVQELPRERISIGSSAIAAAEGALEWTLEYVRERKAFGNRLAEFQNTRFKLAELKTDIELNKAFLEKCIDQYEEGTMDVPTAAMIKLSSTEMQCKVMDECLQLFGGYGYMAEYPIAKAFVDARVQKIYAGTSEIMKEVVARDMLGK